MKHHMYNPDFKFLSDPIEFSKNTNRQLLQYCLGATLYMPGTKEISSAIVKSKFPGLTSMVMCFEDAISEEELPIAENNVINVLGVLLKELVSTNFAIENIPLIFLRVRDPEQFIRFTSILNTNLMNVITGFVFPKFSTINGGQYLDHLEALNKKSNGVLYGMPILESREIAFIETRQNELLGIRKLLKPYKELILNIRVGATDFSSLFGVRRGIDYSIYDIMAVSDCLSDIINVFNREGEEYVISAPVWEYFLVNKEHEATGLSSNKIYSSLLSRNIIINEAIDGLLREIILDKANGFVGKTIIHPSHLKYVNAMQAVTQEEYEDANQILNISGGVAKSPKGNKMNEINPHLSWANRINFRAKAYGVIETELSYTEMFS